VYNHWGRVDDEMNLEPSQIESMLARRVVYHAQMSHTKKSYEKKSKSGTPGNDSSTQNEEKAEQSAVGTASAQVQPKRQTDSRVELQAAGMTQQERTAAAKEHNRRMLARAGLEALGRSVDGDEHEGSEGRQKRKRSGGTVQKIQKIMRKQFSRM
jgi:hypothetical protein